MSEEKQKTTLEKIESLIVDGQKELIDRVEKIVGSAEDRLNGKIDGVEGKLNKKIDAAEKRLEKQIKTAYDFLSHDIREVEKGVKEVKEKLDRHLLVPHAV